MNSLVKNFSSLNAASLVLSGAAQSQQQLLRACLVSGMAAKAVQSLVVAGGVATATYATAHPYAVGQVLRTAGANTGAVNGEAFITKATATAVSFKVPSGVPDGAVSGAITTDLAPAGWVEKYVAGAVSVLAPTVPEATGMVVRVDDGGTTNSRVCAYESMTDANTGQGRTPLAAQSAGGLYWPKSGAASADARPWFLVGDERGFYYAVDPQANGRFTLLYAGDINSYKSGDTWGFALTGNTTDQVAATSVPDGCCGYSRRGSAVGAYLARMHTGIGGAVAARRVGDRHNGTASDVYAGTTGYGWGSYPNGPNNGLLVGGLELVAQGTRGKLPGLYHPTQDMGDTLTSGAVIDGTDDLAGHKLLVLRVAPPSPGSAAGTVLLDMTDWSR